MAQGRTNHRTASLPDTANLARRKLHARRATNARRRVLSLAEPYLQAAHPSHASGSSPPSSSRPVLVPLHFNLRRLPSRILSGRKDSMRDAGNGYDVSIGMKRKRVVSGSENASTARGARSASRAKRRKAMPDSSDEERASGMDVDEQEQWDGSDNSDDDRALDSSDNYLINEAPPRRLLRLRKDELVRLYEAAGLTEDAELLTKPEIVDCIIAARDDVADLPPSSPGLADSGSSDYSSDGGNVAGGEETDFGNRFRNGLRRRATLHDLGRATRRHMPDRCLSMSHIQQPVGDLSPSQGKRKRGSGDFTVAQEPTGISTRRRGTSNASSSRSSPTSSMPPSSLPSPPATRLRTRKASGGVDSSQRSSSTSKGKGKGKHVGFSESVEVSRLPSPEQEESDLTDLTEVESSLSQLKPSPRRLRSKGSVTKLGHDRRRPEEASESSRRVTPMRKAKGRVGNLHESTDEEGNEEDELLSSESEGDEVDQLDESPSPMATPKAKPAQRDRRTPVRNRLRNRQLQTHTPPSDGDDEDSEEEGTVVAGDEGDDEGSVEGEEETLLDEPRKLRNGKIVGEGDVEEGMGGEDEEDEDEEEDEDAAEDSESTGSTADDVDVDEEAEESDEPMEDDVDLTVATAKTLVRMRRDDLVRMCETRDIDATGTKSQLAEALLQWRDQHCSEATTSAPSSTGTARPPSTARAPRRRKTRSKSGSGGGGTPPMLLRTHVHMDEPRTPPLSGRQKEKEGEGELELDLESLGLEDREIPPEKLTKLEKIGSGGFKDVYIGKFKGRRVAIAEFRGQLSAMDIKELKLLGDFDHPNIVRFLGVSIPENTRETPVMIVSELCSNGDLFDYIRNVNPPSLYRVLCIMLDIARGLEYLHLHKPSVIHRDCKSSNILITSKGVAKITDFGLAKVKESTRSMVRSVVGTVNWQAPELWSPHPKYNHKVDVFSCAMVYWEMLQWHNPNKKYPWEGMNEHAIYDAVGAKKQRCVRNCRVSRTAAHARDRPSVAGLRKQWCPEIVDLVERMWQQDPQDRPTMSEVVQELERLVKMYR
ncbi:kinase-like protein [Pilatotrama ljubarskyi]|nr:kinase-like protein [Pilatotrama ljubarskyi]